MPGRIVEQGEISLNGVLFKLSGRVQPMLASVYPQKIIIGDVTKDSQARASVVSWNDWRGGIGLERMTERDPANRAWWSTCQLWFKNHLLLPPLVTTTAASGVAGNFKVEAIGELLNEIYAVFGLVVRKYNNVTDSWGSTLTTLPLVATHALSFRLGGTDYLAFAHTTGFTYTSDGVTWTLNSTDTKFLAFWDTRLWGIDNTGQLWRLTTVAGVGTNDATLPLPTGYVNSLLPARNAAGDIILYAVTRVGVYAHNATGAKFEVTQVTMPPHINNGIGAVNWRESMFLPAGMTIYASVNGTNSAIVTTMGPDLNDGLPDAQQGTIVQLVAAHNELLALIDGTEAAAEVTLFDPGGLGSHIVSNINSDVGYSEILGWNESGWQSKWLSASGTRAAESMLAANAYDIHRLWWGHNGRVSFMALPTGLVNPDQSTTFAYASASEHLTPWLTLDAKDVDALALELNVEVQRATAAETVVVDYALNYATTWTTLGTITTNGITSYRFPNATTPSGTAFRSIRFRLTFARGATTTNSPDVVSVTFVYRKKLKPRWGATFVIDVDHEWRGQTARELQDDLVTAAESNALVEFTFHDDTTAGDPRNYYVDIIALEGEESTGRTFTGLVRVTVAEP